MKLEGFSGCKLEFVVKKTSKNRDYNRRLYAQMRLQDMYRAKFQSSSIKVPKIISHGYDESGLFFFITEYIDGEGVLDYIDKVQDYDKIKHISDLIWSHINVVKKQGFVTWTSDGIKSSVEDFDEKNYEKIHEIEMKGFNLKIIKDNFKEMGKKPTTFCHGDFTLENMIYNEEEDCIYLIDFLDSYIHNYWIDIAKLHQDLDGRWYSFRRGQSDTTDASVDILRKLIGQKLIEEEQEYMKYHSFLMSLVFARILPYVNYDQSVFINNKIKYFLGDKNVF